MVSALALAVLAPVAGAADWQRSVEDYLRNAELSRQQQNAIRNQIRRIEQHRRKQRQQKQKADAKKSLAAIKAAYNKGKKAYQEKRFSAAYLHFQDVANCRLKAAAKMAADATSKVLEIEAMALGRLEQAKILLLQHQPLQAAELLQQIVGEYPYCDAARQARSRLQTLKSVPSVAASMRYVEGKAHEDAESYHKALTIYDEVMQRWPGELAALRAKVAAGAIRADAEKMELVREAKQIEADRVCPTLMSMAKSFIMNYESEKKSKKPDAKVIKDLRLQAIEKLDKILREYPDSPYAKEAARLKARLAAPPAAP
jgi:outer membrane protein assembly factor BamD (BamD/ComL family)